MITGTTIGYGDVYPITDNGKIAAAFYAVIAVNVVGSLLVPCATFLTDLTSDRTKTFDDVDVDGDGVISKDEFNKMKKELNELKKKQKKKK